MSIRIVQLGSARERGEGLRIGTVRRPPRGVPKSEFASRDYYDVWLPDLAPSDELRRSVLEGSISWAAFARQYRAEMKRAGHLLDVFAALSQESNFSMGCYCEDEARCHRSLLRELLAERGAKVR